jgi:hypothetical protein
MPESITKKLKALSQSNSTLEFTLAVAETEEPMSVGLDTKIKLYQDKHYQSLLTWKDTHGL